MRKRTVIKIGDEFNRLLVLKFSHSDHRYRKWFNVRCECGLEKVVMGSAMVSGNTKSCGCLGFEVKRAKRISDNHSEVTAIILGYKSHAANRGFDWELSRDDVLGLIFKHCEYCGTGPSNNKKTKTALVTDLSITGLIEWTLQKATALKMLLLLVKFAITQKAT